MTPRLLFIICISKPDSFLSKNIYLYIMQRFEDINFGSGDDILSSVTASIDKNSDPAVLDPSVRLFNKIFILTKDILYFNAYTKFRIINLNYLTTTLRDLLANLATF